MANRRNKARTESAASLVEQAFANLAAVRSGREPTRFALEAALLGQTGSAEKKRPSAADGLRGEATVESAEGPGRERAAMLADGWPGLPDHLGFTPSAGRGPSGRAE